MRYGTGSELEAITFDYSTTSGPAIDLQAHITYVDVQQHTLTAVDYVFEDRHLKAPPDISVKVSGKNRHNKLFWRENFRHRSPVSYDFGNKFFLGVATDRSVDKEIFLAPLAEGLKP